MRPQLFCSRLSPSWAVPTSAALQLGVQTEQDSPPLPGYWKENGAENHKQGSRGSSIGTSCSPPTHTPQFCCT